MRYLFEAYAGAKASMLEEPNAIKLHGWLFSAGAGLPAFLPR